MIRNTSVVVLSAFTLLAPRPVTAQAARFDDVVRNLRHPDAKIRINAVRLLREARYPEAITPMAALVNDPLDPIQLEAIAAEMAFFLVEDIPDRKRVALLVEVRTPGRAAAAFERGPLATWPRPVPIEVITALLQAVDDDNQRVRAEAIYALGTIARAPLPDAAAPALIKALDHYDPVIRAAAARVIGRLQVKAAADALMKSVNDSNAAARYAAMRALGELHDQRAVQALTEQFNFYGNGEGAWAALEALARIGHSSSVPLFTARLADKDPFLRRASAEGLGRTGDKSGVSALEAGAGNDPSEMVRAAMAFALQKLGRNYITRMVDSMDSAKMVPQIQAYLLELGPPIEKELLPRLQEPEPLIRASVAEVLGAIGGAPSLAALQQLQDKDRDVARAATQAVERIKMRQG